jgi:CheY-like chemotaxis protein
MKIMLVDDDRTMRAILKTLLELENYQIAVWNGQPDSDILTQIREENPKILLLDVYLRDIYGLDILRAVRSDPDLNQIHIVMTSGMPLEDECIAGGADAFLMKPYMPDDLIQILRKVVAEPPL